MAEDVPGTELMLKIKKLGQEIGVKTNLIPERVYLAALKMGLESIINRGMTDLSVKDLEGQEKEAMEAKIKEKAAKNLQDIYDDKTRIIGSKKGKSGIPRAVLTEATRMAKEQLKVLLKKQKVKLSTIKAKDLTAAAQAYLESNPAILKKAYEVIAEREQAETVEFDISALVAGAEVADKVLSAKQAGKVRKRAQAS